MLHNHYYDFTAVEEWGHTCSIFIVLLVVKCEAVDEDFLNKFLPRITVKLIEDIKNCVEESKWLICNHYFPKCMYDTIANQWRYIPVCQESCHSFLSTKHCLPIMNFLSFVWKRIGITCPKVPENNEFPVNCSVYPKSGFKECQYHIFGKFIFLCFLYFLAQKSFLCKYQYNFLLHSVWEMSLNVLFLAMYP